MYFQTPSQNFNNSKSLLSIDILRAFAALGVYYYHQHIGALLATYTHLRWLESTDVFGAVYAVPLFFLVSGYCIHLSNLKYLQNNQPLPLKLYFERRFRRIYPAYLVALIFSIWVNQLTGQMKHLSLADLASHVFLLQGFSVSYFNTINVVFWTISIEMAFYILYPVFYYIRLRYSRRFAMLIALAVSSISIFYFFFNDQLSFPELFCVTNIWFGWCCGALLAEMQWLKTTGLKKTSVALTYGIIFLLFTVLKFFPQRRTILLDYQFDILIWTAPMIWLISKENWFRSHRSSLLNIIIAIGLSSYSLYLFHSPLIAMKNYLAHSILPQGFQPAGVIAGIVLIPVLTWFSYLYIEKPFITKKQ